MKYYLLPFVVAVNNLCGVTTGGDVALRDAVASNECLVSSGDTSNETSVTSTCFDGETFSAESSFNGISSPAPEKVNSEYLGEDFGEPQKVANEYAQEILDKILMDRQYMLTEVMVKDKYEKVRETCKNQHELCTFWSLIGECDANVGYMKVNCGPACHSCENLDISHRCPLNPNVKDAFSPGDVNKLFERIANDKEYKQFKPVVMSKPPEGPWLIMFENAITSEEADRLIELGGLLGYERSTNVGSEKSDGTYDRDVSTTRTSENAWCQGECSTDPLAQRVVQRIENITGISEKNSENLQLLRYEQGQFYNTHSDYIPHQIDRPTGVRILTFYMYLNDVEEGGGTKFPILNTTVQPRRGRAVLWPSVLDANPNVKDSRTVHEAMPVIKGVKFGANAWIHQRDYKTNNQKGC